MKLYGSLSELVKIVFRSNGRETKLDAAQQSGSQTDVTFRLPDLVNNSGSAVVATIVEKDLAQALTNKTIDATNNTLSNIADANIKAAAAIDASKIANGFVSNEEFQYLDGVTSAIQTQINSKQATITGAATTITSSDLTASKALQSDASGKVSASSVTSIELGYVSGVSSAIQTQLNGKQATITGAATTITTSDLTASKALQSDASGKVSASSVTSTELGYLSGVTSAVQTQLGNKAAKGANSDITSLSGLTTPLSAGQGGTGVSSLGTGVSTFLQTPSSANFNSALTDKSGTGTVVFDTTPTLSAPQINSSLVVQQIATPSSPSAGFNKIYTKSDGILYKLDSSGNEVAVGSGAGGSGEVNAVLNPSAATDTTGWAAATNYTVAKDSANSPLSPAVSTSLAMSTTAASAESNTSGISYASFSMPAALRNRKLKIEFFANIPATSLGVWRMSLYDSGGTRVALSTDSSSVTTLPGGVNGKFVAYFDATASATYSLRFTQTTRTSANTMYVTNVIVGPGIQPQGAVVGEWTSYAPVLLTSGDASDITSNVTKTGRYQRRGSSLKVMATVSFSGTPAGLTGGRWKIGIPSGLTVDTSAFPTISTSGNAVGTARARDNGGAQDYTGTAVWFGSGDGNYVSVVGDQGTTPSWTNTSPFTWSTSDVLTVEFEVPIAEWAGSGTVQVAQNDVEYAYNTGNVTGAGLSDNASFAYGPNGTPILAYNSATASNSNTTFRVRFQTPVQPGDQVIVELNDGTGWFGAPSRLPPVSANGASYGIVLSSLTSTDYAVNFGNSGYGPGAAASYGAPGGLWSALAGASPAWRWRVRKSSAGAAVGFGIVSPGTSAGLVSAAGLPGNTTGNVIAAGYVGERLRATGNGAIAAGGNTTRGVGTLAIPSAGVWLISGVCYAVWSGATGGDSRILSSAGPTVGTFPEIGGLASGLNDITASTGTVSNSSTATFPSMIAVFSAAGTIYLNAYTVNNVSAASTAWSITAVRIA